ncbi:MAG: alpha/beta hydrolase [Pseudomonadota bacterium]
MKPGYTVVSHKSVYSLVARLTRAIANIAVGCLLIVSASVNAEIIESGFVNIGGIDQWVQIRGTDAGNPVLLWINGGPGGSTIPDTFAFEPWEKYFTIVMWDQRGEGKTFEKYGPTLADTMTVQRMSEDGVEVAAYLHKRLPKVRIVLLGHSWGSILGIHMIRQRPDLFAAYVGTGQVTYLPAQLEAAYPKLLERAKKLGNIEASMELINAGLPSDSNPAAYEIANKWGAQMEPPRQPPIRPIQSPATNARPPSYIADGVTFSSKTLDSAITSANLPSMGVAFTVPIFFFQGSDDLVTTTAVVRTYFEQIKAPAKGFVVLENAGHSAIFRARDAFLDALLDRVRPLATQ